MESVAGTHGLKCSLPPAVLHLLRTALSPFAGPLWTMSMLGKLLAGLPCEVRVHIFCLALGFPTAGALLRNWLKLAQVSQDCSTASSLLCDSGEPPCTVSSDMLPCCRLFKISLTCCTCACMLRSART